MSRRLLSLRALLLLAGAGALVANCSQSDTVLLVHVTASIPVAGIQQLHATIRVGGQTHSHDVPDAPAAIALPTSFTVQLARSFNGELSINIDARDATGAVVASGNQTVSPLQVGAQNELTVDLAPGPAPDAGTDGPPTTTGTGGAVGTGGVSGSGGAAAGSGGAAAGIAGAGGGSSATGGSAGSGAAGHGGGVGTGGHASGGAIGTGGTASGGVVGTGGVTSSGGMTGTGGVTASGGASSGGGGDAGGGTAGASGDMGGAGGDGS